MQLKCNSIKTRRECRYN